MINNNECCSLLGLSNAIGPIVNRLNEENTRVSVASAIIALLNYITKNTSNDTDNCIINATEVENGIEFEWEDGHTDTINFPISDDDYVTGGSISGSNLILTRKSGGSVTIGLSGFIPTGSLKDGLLDDVLIITLNGNKFLKFIWNADANKDPISIPLPSDKYLSSALIEINEDGYILELTLNDGTTIPVDFDGLVASIKNSMPFIPGYFYSSKKPDKNGKITVLENEDVFEFIGTDLVNEAPDNFGKHRYIVYSNDGNTYRLVAQFKEPTKNRYMLFSSYTGSVGKSNSVSLPRGYMYIALMHTPTTDPGIGDNDYPDPTARRDDRFYLYRMCKADLNSGIPRELIYFKGPELNALTVYYNGTLGSSILENCTDAEMIINSAFRNVKDGTNLFPKNTAGTKYKPTATDTWNDTNTVRTIKGYGLAIHYNLLIRKENSDIDVNYTNKSDYTLYEFTDKDSATVNNTALPTGNAYKKLSLEKAKLCNFVDTKKRIRVNESLEGYNEITIPNASTRTSYCYSIDKNYKLDIKNSYESDYEHVGTEYVKYLKPKDLIYNTTVDNLAFYFIILAYLVLNFEQTYTYTQSANGDLVYDATNEVYIPYNAQQHAGEDRYTLKVEFNYGASKQFGKSNAGDNTYAFTKKEDVSPAGSVSTTDTIRDLGTVRFYNNKEWLGVYKKTYGVIHINDQDEKVDEYDEDDLSISEHIAPEDITWNRVINDPLYTDDPSYDSLAPVYSDFAPADITGNNLFVYSNLENWILNDADITFLETTAAQSEYNTWELEQVANGVELTDALKNAKLEEIKNRYKEPRRTKRLNFMWSNIIGDILYSKRLGKNTDNIPFNSDYKDTLGWNNRYKIYTLGSSGILSLMIGLYVNGQKYNEETSLFDCIITATFNVVTDKATITGTANVTVGSYDYLTISNKCYNFYSSPSLSDKLTMFSGVHPIANVTRINAVGQRLSDPTNLVSIQKG